jgi:hypothetical protein
MDWANLISLLRYPLEILAAGLAVAPALIVWQARGYSPDPMPDPYGILRPSSRRGGGRRRPWILPLLALIVYGAMSEATGTLAWVADRTATIPNGAEILLAFKPCVALLMVSVTLMVTHADRREDESLGGMLLVGLLILLVAPPLAMAVAMR